MNSPWDVIGTSAAGVPSAPAQSLNDWSLAGESPVGASWKMPAGTAAQPSTLDYAIASPIGRLLQQNVVSPILNALPTMLGGQANLLSAFGRYPNAISNFNQWTANKAAIPAQMEDVFYNNALAATRNTPQYQQNVPQAEKAQSLDNGPLGKMFPTIEPSIAGLAALASTGSLGASNAAADAAQTAGSSYAVANPLKSIGYGLVGALGTGQPAENTLSSALAADQKSPWEAANEMLRRYINADTDGGGPSIDAMKAKLSRAAALGQPLTIADVAGDATQGKLQGIAQQPTKTASSIASMLKGRQAGAQGDALDAAATYLTPNMSTRQTAEALIEARAKAAGPLYKKAYDTDNSSALLPVLENNFADASAAHMAAQKELSQAQTSLTAAQGSHLPSDNVYATSNRNAAIGSAQGYVDQAQSKVAQLAQAKQDALQRLNDAQQMAASGVKGTVWSPRLQQFLNDPIIQQGIGRGFQLERLDALAQGRPFNPTEYAITGTAEDGSPVLSSVPNMRSLDVAKQGLDDIVGNSRDQLTGRLSAFGRAVDGVRRSFLNELDKLNPDYAAARQAYSTPSVGLEALREGRKIFSKDPEDISADVQRFGAGSPDHDLYLTGAAQAIKNKVLGARDVSNMATPVAGNELNRMRISAAIADPQKSQNYLDALDAISTAAQTKNTLLGNSATAKRLAAQQAETTRVNPFDVGEAVLGAASGNHGMIASAAARLGLNRIVPWLQGAHVQEAAFANAMINPDLSHNLSLLTQMQSAPSAGYFGGANSLPYLLIPPANHLQNYLPVATNQR